MKPNYIAFAGGLLLAACESSTGPTSNVQYSLSECMNDAAKAGAGEAGAVQGQLLFKSKDSLSLAIPMVLLCKGDFSIVASIASPETVSIAVAYPENGDRSKCVCEKNVTIGYRSPSAGLESVRFVKTDGGVYELKE
jgi:hypothetical protein